MNGFALPSNLLLSKLSPSSLGSLLKHATAVDLPLHTVLYNETSIPRYVYFPFTGLVSVVTVVPSGESAEVNFIGREGMTGCLHLLGPAPLPTRCMMQLAGSGLRVPFADAQQAFANSAEVRGRILEFVQEQAASMGQIAACNRLHDAEQRLIRWLLMAQDRTGYDTLGFTHEYLSQMIATQRSTVTIIAGALQRRGLIRYSRGRIQIVDRAGMEAASCVCNRVIKRLLEGLYRGSGNTLSGMPMQDIRPESSESSLAS